MTIASSSTDVEVDAAGLLFQRLKWAAVVGALCALAVLLLYFVNFHGALSENTAHWGEFGDYVGGVLNPFFSFLALLALLATFALQVRQLRISAKELKDSAGALAKQNFEASFFQLLRLHNDIVNAIDLTKDGRVTSKGRDCFRFFVAKLEKEIPSNGLQDFEQFIRIYNLFHIEFEKEVGHYFRLLYHIVKLVSKTEGIDKRFYTNLVRAQLSSAEQQLLFYNCLSRWGSEKFMPLVEEFALLKTMPRTILPEDLLLRKYKPSAFGGEYPTPLL